jgi:hypothetical protein
MEYVCDAFASLALFAVWECEWHIFSVGRKDPS